MTEPYQPRSRPNMTAKPKTSPPANIPEHFKPHDFVMPNCGTNQKANLTILRRYAKLPCGAKRDALIVKPGIAKSFVLACVYPWLVTNLMRDMVDRGLLVEGEPFEIPGERPHQITQIDMVGFNLQTRERPGRAAQWLGAPVIVWMMMKKYKRKDKLKLLYLPTIELIVPGDSNVVA